VKLNKNLVIVITVLFTFITFYFAWNSFHNYFNQPDTNSTFVDTIYPSKTISEGSFTLKAGFSPDNKWDYTLTGQLPNPCYSANVEELVAESYPEQVHINVTVIPPKKDVVCIQTISEFKKTGTINASEKATINLSVK
jgi:hypothetical protein